MKDSSGQNQFFSTDPNNLGCGTIIILIIIAAVAILINCSYDSNDSGSQKNNYTQSYSKTPIDSDDPISWRSKEEIQEKQSDYLRNAKYSCSRCGMKSTSPLNDGYVHGINGVCMYCVDYLKSRKK